LQLFCAFCLENMFFRIVHFIILGVVCLESYGLSTKNIVDIRFLCYNDDDWAERRFDLCIFLPIRILSVF